MNAKMAVVAAVVTVLGVGLYEFGRSRIGKKLGVAPAADDRTAVTASMRQRVLSGSAEEFGLTPIGTVWGVLMEMGAPEGWASLVALSDGTTSLYFSGGGGIIGGGGHDKVKTAAIELCRLAHAGGRVGAVVKTFPTPEPERIRFYFLTTEGVRTIDESEATLGEGGHKLSPLFFASHEVITQLRLAAPTPNGG